MAMISEESRALAQMEVIFEEKVPVFASGLGSPKFLLERAHAQGYDATGHTAQIGTLSI